MSFWHLLFDICWPHFYRLLPFNHLILCIIMAFPLNPRGYSHHLQFDLWHLLLENGNVFIHNAQTWNTGSFPQWTFLIWNSFSWYRTKCERTLPLIRTTFATTPAKLCVCRHYSMQQLRALQVLFKLFMILCFKWEQTGNKMFKQKKKKKMWLNWSKKFF